MTDVGYASWHANLGDSELCNNGPLLTARFKSQLLDWELFAVTKSESSSGQKGAIHVAFLFFERFCRV